MARPQSQTCLDPRLRFPQPHCRLACPHQAARLARILHQHEDGRAAFELWKAAIDGGGPDNITLAVARLAD